MLLAKQLVADIRPEFPGTQNGTNDPVIAIPQARTRRLARRTYPPGRSLFHEQNFILIVNLGQLHLDDFIRRGLHHAAHESRFNGQFAMAAVDQDTQLHPARAALGK